MTTFCFFSCYLFYDYISHLQIHTFINISSQALTAAHHDTILHSYIWWWRAFAHDLLTFVHENSFTVINHSLSFLYFVYVCYSFMKWYLKHKTGGFNNNGKTYQKGNPNNYLCTYELYGPVLNAFDAGSIHYLGKWEGDGPWKDSFWGPEKWHRADTLLSVSCELVVNLALAPSWVLMGLSLKLKYSHSPLNLRILSSTCVPFTFTTVQVPNLAQSHTKRITV